jgi:tRNA-dihydrouridine synthase 1
MGSSTKAVDFNKKLNDSAHQDPEERRKKKKKKKKEKKARKDKEHKEKKKRRKEQSSPEEPNKKQKTQTHSDTTAAVVVERRPLHFDYKYILSPMVGASELAFRLLCRKYGAQLAYTPMMCATTFSSSEEFRTREFQTIPEDRPLVCHFSANNPTDFARAAKLAEPYCDAIDLNLGCPQRTAFVGHYGSYLLGNEDRDLVLDIVRAGMNAVSIPICCKIRLLDTFEETMELVLQLRDAGASLIAIHARYRASFERKGPGARDGPALLDQVMEIKKAVSDVVIIVNGNVITHDDVTRNLALTRADGIMSAEGILDNPALFLPRIGSRDEAEKKVMIADPSPLFKSDNKKERKLRKRLREIETLEAKIKSQGEDSINEEERKKLSNKKKVETSLAEITAQPNEEIPSSNSTPKITTISLGELYKNADDALTLANEYLGLVRRYPTAIRTVVFHTRRMLKDTLNQFQLMEECVACQTVDQVQAIVDRLQTYQKDPETFTYDRKKAEQQKEAREQKKREEGKRKQFEARMIRKAKREGKTDLEHYLRIGAQLPTQETISKLKALSRDEQLQRWKQDHSQHCMAFHLEESGGCKRDRACAFLHTDAKSAHSFVESDEVAG